MDGAVDVQEQWKVVDDDDRYEVSDQGRIRNKATQQVRAIRIRDGYAIVRMRKGTKERGRFVHRLVATAFLPEPKPDQVMVNHKNCDRADNRVENLEWVNAQENAVHSAEMRGIGLRKIPDNLLKEVRHLRSERYSLREIAEVTGLSMATVNNCCKDGVEVIKIGLATRKKIFKLMRAWQTELGE